MNEYVSYSCNQAGFEIVKRKLDVGKRVFVVDMITAHIVWNLIERRRELRAPDIENNYPASFFSKDRDGAAKVLSADQVRKEFRAMKAGEPPLRSVQKKAWRGTYCVCGCPLLPTHSEHAMPVMRGIDPDYVEISGEPAHDVVAWLPDVRPTIRNESNDSDVWNARRLIHETAASTGGPRVAGWSRWTII